MDPLGMDDPRSIGPFTLVGRLGYGGMGQVFLGRLPSGRLAAVKVVHPHLAAQQDFRERFTREVEAARTVAGFFTAPIVDADTRAEKPWLATAYIDGPTLESAVQRNGPLSAETVRTMMLGLVEALMAIHHARLVHRDLKPSNIVLASDGPRVIDFGIVRALDDLQITDYGTVLGTPSYMSPEQARGDAEITAASDVFALGAVLVFACTGHPPFRGAHHFAVLHNINSGHPDLNGVPAQLVPVVSACLAKEPADRPPLAGLLNASNAASDAAPGPAPVRRDKWWLRQG